MQDSRAVNKRGKLQSIPWYIYQRQIIIVKYSGHGNMRGVTWGVVMVKKHSVSSMLLGYFTQFVTVLTFSK